MRKYIKAGGGLLLICVIASGMMMGKHKTLEGVHVLENIISKGEYIFYVNADQTDFYTFNVSGFNKNASYSVYDTNTEELIHSGKFGYVSEGYYPFIEMELEEGHVYRVNLLLKDKYTFGMANIERLE